MAHKLDRRDVLIAAGMLAGAAATLGLTGTPSVAQTPIPTGANP